MTSFHSAFIWILVALQIPPDSFAYGNSGYYIDSEDSRTVFHTKIPKADLEEMHHEFVRLLGLPKELLGAGVSDYTREAVPKFLLSAYKKIIQSEDQRRSDDNKPLDEAERAPQQRRRRRRRSIEDADTNFSDHHAQMIDDSDTIMSFLNNQKMDPLYERFNGTQLAFDLSHVNAENEATLMMAELHLYKIQFPTNRTDGDRVIITINAVRTVHG